MKLVPKSAGAQMLQELDLVRRYCLTKSPGLAGVALLPHYVIVSAEDKQFGKEFAFTDGARIFFGPRFFSEHPKSQAYILIHEVLHVALRHPQRGMALRNKVRKAGAFWSAKLYNWCVDAIVNHAIITNAAPWTNQPSCGLITFDVMLPAAKLQERPAHTWGAEELYLTLAKNMTEEGLVAFEAGLPANAVDMADIMEDVSPDTLEEMRDWRNRLERGAAGDSPMGVLRSVLFDIPRTKTPWYTRLRKFVSAHVMPETQPSSSRPSKSSLSLNAFYAVSGRSENVPFIPASKPKCGIKKIVVIVDTSGSIDDTMCNHFGAEVQTIRHSTGCDLVLITCDAAVHQVINIGAFDDFKSIMKKEGFKGGGGTDFRPAIAEAEKIVGAAVIIYFTDMQGSFPDRCRLPLLWASTCEHYTKPPCGSVCVINVES